MGLQLILQHVEVGFPYVMGLQCIKILGIISFRKEAYVTTDEPVESYHGITLAQD